MPPRSKPFAPCPMDAVLRLLMGPWTTYILWVLLNHGEVRFGALRRLVPGISAKVLTDRLRLLEDEGIVARRYAPTIPPSVSYCLTERGHELREALDGIQALAMRWQLQDQHRAA
jgi:DNA-binding HxlR family transcriptional regulator